MSAPVLATKQCSKCGETKPLSEFHRDRTNRDGRHSWCAVCMRTLVNERQAVRRAEMGDEAWLAHQRQLLARSRARRNNDTERRYGKARSRAVQRLIDAHRAEFDALLAQERYAEEAKAG